MTACTRAGRAVGRRRAGSFGSSPLALRRAAAGPRPSIVVCLHLRLSPVARLVTRAAGAPRRVPARDRSLEARSAGWSAGRWGARMSSSANSEHTARRFRAANPGMLTAADLRVSPRRGRGRRAPVRPRSAHAASRARSPSSSGDWPAPSATRAMTCSSICGRGSATEVPGRAPRRGGGRRRSDAPRGPGRRARRATCGSSGACPTRRSTLSIGRAPSS